MIDLAGKTALVTGGARRLGKAIALLLARNGANVVIHYGSSEADARALVAELQRLGVRSTALQADLGAPENAGRLFAMADGICGPLSIVVNNASVFPTSTFENFQPRDVHDSVDLHAMTPALLARALHATGREDCAVINMIDCRIADYDRNHLAYHLGKRMLYTLTRIMAVELAPRVRVNGVAPGLVLPPAGKDESYLASLAHSTPLDRYGNADDVAEAVLFLLRSDFITGQVVYVDGGRNLRGTMYGV